MNTITTNKHSTGIGRYTRFDRKMHKEFAFNTLLAFTNYTIIDSLAQRECIQMRLVSIRAADDRRFHSSFVERYTMRYCTNVRTGQLTGHVDILNIFWFTLLLHIIIF